MSRRYPDGPMSLALEGAQLRRRVCQGNAFGLFWSRRVGEERALGFPRGNSSSFPGTGAPDRPLLLAEVTRHLRLGVLPKSRTPPPEI